MPGNRPIGISSTGVFGPTSNDTTKRGSIISASPVLISTIEAKARIFFSISGTIL